MLKDTFEQSFHTGRTERARSSAININTHILVLRFSGTASASRPRLYIDLRQTRYGTVEK
jgi:hypothetical protein